LDLKRLCAGKIRLHLCRIARTAFPSGHAIGIDRVLVLTGKFMQWNISINKGGSITGVFPPQGDANHT
jgi:hypothetical protein